MITTRAPDGANNIWYLNCHVTSEFPFTNRCRASFMDRRFRIALSLTITQQNEGPKPQGLKPKTLTLQCQLSFICDGCFVSGQLLQIQLYFSRQMFHLLKIKSNCTQGTQNWTQGTQNCTQAGRTKLWKSLKEILHLQFQLHFLFCK